MVNFVSEAGKGMSPDPRAGRKIGEQTKKLQQMRDDLKLKWGELKQKSYEPLYQAKRQQIQARQEIKRPAPRRPTVQRAKPAIPSPLKASKQAPAPTKKSSPGDKPVGKPLQKQPKGINAQASANRSKVDSDTSQNEYAEYQDRIYQINGILQRPSSNKASTEKAVLDVIHDVCKKRIDHAVRMGMTPKASVRMDSHRNDGIDAMITDLTNRLCPKTYKLLASHSIEDKYTELVKQLEQEYRSGNKYAWGIYQLLQIRMISENLVKGSDMASYDSQRLTSQIDKAHVSIIDIVKNYRTISKELILDAMFPVAMIGAASSRLDEMGYKNNLEIERCRSYGEAMKALLSIDEGSFSSETKELVLSQKESKPYRNMALYTKEKDNIEGECTRKMLGIISDNAQIKLANQRGSALLDNKEDIEYIVSLLRMQSFGKVFEPDSPKVYIDGEIENINEKLLGIYAKARETMEMNMVDAIAKGNPQWNRNTIRKKMQQVLKNSEPPWTIDELKACLKSSSQLKLATTKEDIKKWKEACDEEMQKTEKHAAEIDGMIDSVLSNVKKSGTRSAEIAKLLSELSDASILVASEIPAAAIWLKKEGISDVVRKGFPFEKSHELLLLLNSKQKLLPHERRQQAILMKLCLTGHQVQALLENRKALRGVYNKSKAIKKERNKELQKLRDKVTREGPESNMQKLVTVLQNGNGYWMKEVQMAKVAALSEHYKAEMRVAKEMLSNIALDTDSNFGSGVARMQRRAQQNMKMAEYYEELYPELTATISGVVSNMIISEDNKRDYQPELVDDIMDRFVRLALNKGVHNIRGEIKPGDDKQKVAKRLSEELVEVARSLVKNSYTIAGNQDDKIKLVQKNVSFMFSEDQILQSLQRVNSDRV